jgi:hypothetical protein
MRIYSKQTEFIQFNTFSYFSLSSVIFVWFQRQEARNKHNSMKKNDEIGQAVKSFDHCTRFWKDAQFLMQLYKGWKLFLTGKLAIVYKMSLLSLLKMRFFYWKQRIWVPVRPLYSSPKTTFSTFRPKQRELQSSQYQNSTWFFTGVPCGQVLHISLTLTVCLPQFAVCFYRAFKPLL